jgi:predicted metal-dependent hydrolase
LVNQRNLDPRFLAFVQLFNEEKFFEAHEELEILWRQEKGEARDFYQGLIQIAAAFVHIQKDTPEGAQKLYQTASRYLKAYPPFYFSLNLQNLLQEVRISIFTREKFPRIYLKSEESQGTSGA